jgi:hypothetical protein
MRVGVDDTDDRAIGGRVFPFERKTRFLSATPENQLANAGANRINCNHRLARWLEILI